MTTSRLAALAALVTLVSAGCSDGPVAAPVDPDKARDALVTTLDAWKAGKKIGALAADFPPIVAQDFDWMAGVPLDSYEVQGDGTPQDANLRVAVKLRLRGKPAKTVYYVVGTDKTLTVFRALE